jgi:hypothetical protein
VSREARLQALLARLAEENRCLLALLRLGYSRGEARRLLAAVQRRAI